MVLYKRKQVAFVPPPPIPHDLSTHVWLIKQTKEWFLNYEEYLDRLDYYNQNKFVCEITGNSCLTYFEAYYSEQNEMREVDKNFPEALKEHLLRYLNFNRCTRLDQLVDRVYTMFKNDYFPGETIYLRNLDHDQSQQLNLLTSVKSRGIIREKVQYSQEQPTKYLVISLLHGQQQIVSSHNISRDRNHFTKWLIKTFIKLTMSRSHKVGAPWVVKTKYAKKYSIPTNYPDDLKQFIDSTPTGEVSFIQPKKKRGPQPKDPNDDESVINELKKRKFIKDEFKHNSPMSDNNGNVSYRKKFPNHYIPDVYQKELDEEEPGSTPSYTFSQFQPTKKTMVEDLELKFDLQNPKPRPKTLMTLQNDQDEKLTSISEALQSWTFINVYHNVLHIDTFTFDDYVYAMGWNYEQINELGQCDLLNEIWCCLLGAIVSNELPSQKETKAKNQSNNNNSDIFGLNIQIPSEDDEFDTHEDDEEEINGSESESDAKPLNIDDAKSDDDEELDEKINDKPKLHNAYEVMNYRGIPWHDRLRKRNFKDGNWQCILLGVLSMVEHIPIYQPIIEEIYKVLAPLDISLTTPITVRQQFYEHLNINLKFKAINILTELIITSPLVRNYIDESLENSTTIRRQKLENLKEYKLNLDIYQKAQQSIRKYLPENAETNTTIDMNEMEIKISKDNPLVQELCQERKLALIKLNQIKSEKKLFEQRLTELDCQRVKLLGKDRLFNRYWWFENNGLPNLHGTSLDDDEEEEDDDDEEKVKHEDVHEIEPDSDDDEVKDETYLMGRLWVQGPCVNDLNVNFNVNFDFTQEIDDQIGFKQYQDVDQQLKKGETKKMNFQHLSTDFKQTMKSKFNLTFQDGEIYETENNEMIIDYEGSLLCPLNKISHLQRKVIEECPDPILNGSNWRYYDSPEDISKLISWLNPWGKRESALRKELSSTKDAIISSMKARRKALWIDSTPNEELKLMKNIQELREKDFNIEVKEEEEEIGSKRRMRSKELNRKRQKLNTIEEVLEKGNEQDAKQWIESLQDELSKKKYQREISRVSEWVNSKSLDLFTKSLYEGGDKPKGKKQPKKSK